MKLSTFTFALVAWAAVAHSSASDLAEVCSEESPTQAQALLQARHEVQPHHYKLLEEGSKLAATVAEALGTNPSGAAATLDEVGYAAVADRCCQAEMKQFIERQAISLDLEVCDTNGVNGLAPYHSCEKGPLTFAELTSQLLDASVERCLWVATKGNCKPKPADCPDFGGVPPVSDCACSRAKAAKLDFTAAAATVTNNNLGGVGPSSGASELRFANVGTSDTGAAFDLVVTTLGAYQTKNPGLNGITDGFGVISISEGSGSFSGLTEFKFSFMEPGTSTPVMLPEVHMAIFDLDGDNATGIETAASKGYRGYVTDVTPSVVASRLPDGRTKFSADGSTANVPNPKDPNSLTAEQRRNSVMYFYVNVTSFDLTFGIESGIYGRNLFFSGESALNDRCGE